MVQVERLNAEGVRKSPLFPQAVRSGNLIFVSGQVAFNEQGIIVGVGDCTAQTETILSNVSRILAAANTDLAHIVKITCYLTTVANYEAYNRVRQKWFAGAAPASTTVIVAGLVRPELLVEIDTVAVSS